MAKQKENKRPNSRSSLLKSGCYAACYTQNGFFVKVKPALTIDKVVFSFVKKGTSGSGFDIYVNIDKFDLLCDDILSRELLRNLQGSSLEAPAWEEVTGEKGSKTLKLFQGKSGIVINGYVKDKNQAANVPVKYNDLRTIAKWHRRISNIYFDKMAQVCINTMVSNSRYFEQNDDDEDEDLPGANESTEVKGQDSKERQSSQPANTKDNTPAESAKPGSDEKTTNPNEVFVIIKTSTVVKEFGSHKNFCFKGITKNGKELTFIVALSNIPTIGEKKWNAFYDHTKVHEGFICNIGYVKCQDRLLVTNIESVANAMP